MKTILPTFTLILDCGGVTYEQVFTEYPKAFITALNNCLLSNGKQFSVYSEGTTKTVVKWEADDVTIVQDPFYYPQTGKWYQFVDHVIAGKLLSRVCNEIKQRES